MTATMVHSRGIVLAYCATIFQTKYLGYEEFSSRKPAESNQQRWQFLEKEYEAGQVVSASVNAIAF